MFDDSAKPIGVYRAGTDDQLRVAYDDSTTEEWWAIPIADAAGLVRAYEKATGSNGGFPPGDDWYWSVDPEIFTKNEGGGEHRPEGGEGNDAQPQGEPEEGDQEGDPDQGDDSGEGEEMKDDQGDEGYDHEGRDKSGEDDPMDNPFVDDIWGQIKPRVREMDRHTAEHIVDYVVKKIAAQGGGGGGAPGLILKFEKGKVGKVDGVTHYMFPKVLAAVQRGVNMYLPGPPGTGKSHMVTQIAEALGIPFGVTSFSPMSTESKLLGFRNAHGETVRTVFRDRYEFGGGMLLDELDNANGAIIAVMNGGLANGFMEFPDGVVERHPDFVCIATANTLGTGPTAEFAGRQKLDPATLNRFVKIFIDTDENMEDSIINQMIGATTGQAWLKKVRHVRRAVADLKIKHFVTMRDSINGAKLIAPGAGKFSQVEALEHTILGVLTPDQVEKIKAWRG